MSSSVPERMLDRLFGPGNDCSLEEFLAGKHGEEVVACVRSAQARAQGGASSPLVFPRESGDRLEWFGLSFDDTQAELLREGLLAFIGPSYSDFTGQFAALDLDDSYERYLHRVTDGRVFRLRPPTEGDAREISRSVELMLSVWDSRPTRTLSAIRPVGRILRDFELALEVGDSRAAYNYHRELREGGRLAAENLSYLEIRLWAAIGEWEEVLGLPEFQTVLSMRRPRRVTEEIARAIYRARLAGFESQDDAEGALDAFRSDVLESYRPFFRTRAGSVVPEVLKLFMMFAVTAEPAHLSLRDEILTAEGVGYEDRRYLRALAGDVGASPVTVGPSLEDSIAAAVEALEREDYELAFSTAVELRSGPERARILVLSAFELQTVDAARTALMSVEDLADQDRESLLHPRLTRLAWGELVESVRLVDGAPNDWSEWLSRLRDDGPWDEALATAADGAERWNADGFAVSPSATSAVSQLVSYDYPADSAEILDEAIPYLLRFLNRCPVTGLMRDVYESALLFLQLRDSFTRQDLDAMVDLVWLTFEAGIAEDQYPTRLQDLSDVWARLDSAAHADWAVDLLDVLASHPSPAPDLRTSLAATIAGSMNPYVHRLEPGTLEVLSHLAEELGAAGVLQRPPKAQEVGAGQDPLSLLDASSIGIYSLTESAAMRAKRFLEGRLPSTKIVVNHDTVGTPALRALAQESDIVVMAVRSAQHAATDFIKMNRPGTRPTLVAAGKGSSSIIRELYGLAEQRRQTEAA